MAQRQFRSDDTSLWEDGFGHARYGNVSVTSDTQVAVSRSSCTGTSGSLNLSISTASSFTNGMCVMIWQARGSDLSDGNWEFNRISTGGGTTSLVMRYPLTRTYSDSGANQSEIVEIYETNSLSVDNGSLMYPYAWDANTGGTMVLMGNSLEITNGQLYASGKGYLGADGHGATGGTTTGHQGEGTGGAKNTQSSAANGNGGGGGAGGNPGRSGGGGGGHATAGSNGTSHAGTTAGTGGSAIGEADGTYLVFGGGGGAGGQDSGESGGAGANGGGIIIAVFRDITIYGSGSIAATGASASPTSQSGGGGGGAGGSILIKGQNIELSTNRIYTTPGNGGLSTFTGRGGNGAYGFTSVEYSDSLSGSVSESVYVTRQDRSLRRSSGMHQIIG